MATAINDIIQVTARFTLHGSVVMNVFYVRADDAVSDDQDLRDDLAAWVNDGNELVAGQQSNELAAVDILMVNLTQEVNLGASEWLSYAGGTVAGDALASHDAGLVTFIVPILGSRGRKFIAGIAEGGTDDSVFIAGVITDMGDYGFYFYQPFTGFVTSAEYTPVLQRQIGSPAIYAYTPFTGWSVSSNVATMGSRQKGVGI